MRLRFCLGLGVALLLGLAAGCGGAGDDRRDAGWDDDLDIFPPDFWDPGERPATPCGDGGDGAACQVDGQDGPATDFCRDSPCVYGTCRERADGFFCECAPGYAGSLCDECAPGYHPEGLRCVSDAP
ncbi:MAG TPA: hypothetical protein PK668_11285 [Myxococcota bacterium]|nr:hypothetical protein [Myxococcota bacterium]HRY93251.1 hypothetical protein [Myxococcota bacterium]HSA20697.1 hypothetical protein [Myxococcota bacterium]